MTTRATLALNMEVPMSKVETDQSTSRLSCMWRKLLTFVLCLMVVGLTVKQCIWESSASSTVFQWQLGGRLLMAF